jgi:uncharacterized protein YjbI with pentapeptide repeats
MTRDEILRAIADGAKLIGANLSGADLYGANLSGANLSRADLSDTNLIGADLSGADLIGADLSRANLSRANLSRADLNRADLSDTKLRGTCIDPKTASHARAVVKALSARRPSGLIVYRTMESQSCGNTTYTPGKTYVAPVLSWSTETGCHPGIYAGSLDEILRQYPGKKIVRCYVRNGDWVPVPGKNCIRCKRIRVLGRVER